MASFKIKGFDSGLHTFTVLGSENKPQAVKLFPTPTCTCPSTSQCYHILAAWNGRHSQAHKVQLDSASQKCL